jgi:hypothetical protein
MLIDLTGHSKYVTNAAFSPDGKKIVTIADENTAKIWDAQTGNLITDLTDYRHIYSVAFLAGWKKDHHRFERRTAKIGMYKPEEDRRSHRTYGRCKQCCVLSQWEENRHRF